MNIWKLISRLCQLLVVGLLVVIVVRLFLPQIERQRQLRAREQALRDDIQRAGEELRLLRIKQERLKTEPEFIERIAREDWGYAKPGETVFRFVDEAP